MPRVSPNSSMTRRLEVQEKLAGERSKRPVDRPKPQPPVYDANRATSGRKPSPGKFSELARPKDELIAGDLKKRLVEIQREKERYQAMKRSPIDDDKHVRFARMNENIDIFHDDHEVVGETDTRYKYDIETDEDDIFEDDDSVIEFDEFQ